MGYQQFNILLVIIDRYAVIVFITAVFRISPKGYALILVRNYINLPRTDITVTIGRTFIINHWWKEMKHFI